MPIIRHAASGVIGLNIGLKILGLKGLFRVQGLGFRVFGVHKGFPFEGPCKYPTSIGSIWLFGSVSERSKVLTRRDARDPSKKL